MRQRLGNSDVPHLVRALQIADDDLKIGELFEPFSFADSVKE
jgi:hypothetical protein